MRQKITNGLMVWWPAVERVFKILQRLAYLGITEAMYTNIYPVETTDRLDMDKMGSYGIRKIESWRSWFKGRKSSVFVEEYREALGELARQAQIGPRAQRRRKLRANLWTRWTWLLDSTIGPWYLPKSWTVLPVLEQLGIGKEKDKTDAVGSLQAVKKYDPQFQQLRGNLAVVKAIVSVTAAHCRWRRDVHVLSIEATSICQN